MRGDRGQPQQLNFQLCLNRLNFSTNAWRPTTKEKEQPMLTLDSKPPYCTLQRKNGGGFAGATLKVPP